MGGKLGYIYGVINVLAVFSAYFLIPELKGRSLEEVDQLFASNKPLRNFSSVQTHSATEIYGEAVLAKSDYLAADVVALGKV